MGLAALLWLGAIAAGTDVKPAEEKVTTKVVNYAGLADFIKQNRGKVIVVDFWQNSCVPCKKEFHNLVELHTGHGKDNFLAVSVDLDDPSDKDLMGRVLKFLEGQNASLTNLVLDEKPEAWQKQLGFSAVPQVYVFYPSGEWQKFQDYEKVKPLVAELLQKK